MACFAVIILSGLISISAAEEACKVYAAVGQSLILSLNFAELANTHGLKWTHNGTILFHRKQGKVSVGKLEDISATGSLQLKNTQFSSAGAYQADVFHPNGSLAKEWRGRVCVMDKVSKPQLTYQCDFKSGTIHLNCIVTKPQGLVFSWMLDDVMLTSEIRQTMSVSLEQLIGKRSFKCSVANKVSRQGSDTVHPTCTSPSPSPPNLLCFPSKTVLAAATGAVSLVLLLIMIIVMLCFYYRCNKTQTGHGVKGGVRMLSLNKRELDSISRDYESMHPTVDPRPPSPKPSPRACYQNVSPQEAETGNSPLQLPTVAEGRQPSPVPKPRTKKTNI